MKHMSGVDLLAKIEPIIRHAGKYVYSQFGKSIVQEIKQDKSIVTQVDRYSEQYIVENLFRLFPDTNVYAEESGIMDNGSSWTWVIDPLDGTTNFVQAIPFFCISCALTFQGRPYFALVFDPVRDELFCASRDFGTVCNGNAIHVAQKKKLAESLVSIGYSHKQSPFMSRLVDRINLKVFAFRYFGSAVLHQAYLAAGRIDLLFIKHIKWWDIAAGSLLVHCAGGKITNDTMEEVEENAQGIIAGNRILYEQFVTFLAKNQG